MKFATLPDGTKDGRLFIVSRDMTRAQPAIGAHTMQELMERWDEIENGGRSSASTRVDK